MTRVLFVDDQPNVLASLRQAMRSYRREWTMVFCENSVQALEALASEPFDVVVSDIDMPGMDGSELLTLVRDLYPNAVRIAISGQSEHEQMFRALGPAHQFLTKPYNADLLYDTITRATRLSKRLGNPRLQALVSELESLPSLPSIYLELVEELRYKEASIARIGVLISRDAGMTAKVLQLVNSSFFGLPVHVADASHAAALLGLNMLRPLVLAASIFRQMEESKVPEEFLERTLEHSMAVGCLARKLAESATDSAINDSDTIDNAMLAGVLHDVGKLVLADNFGAEYQTLNQTAKDLGMPLRVAEVERYGATHATVGGYLLGLWGLPHDILEAVAYHHDPSASTNSAHSPLAFVHAANTIVMRNHVGDEHNPSAEFDMVYLKKMKLDTHLAEWHKLAQQEEVST